MCVNYICRLGGNDRDKKSVHLIKNTDKLSCYNQIKLELSVAEKMSSEVGS